MAALTAVFSRTLPDGPMYRPRCSRSLATPNPPFKRCQIHSSKTGDIRLTLAPQAQCLADGNRPIVTLFLCAEWHWRITPRKNLWTTPEYSPSTAVSLYADRLLVPSFDRRGKGRGKFVSLSRPLPIPLNALVISEPRSKPRETIQCRVMSDWPRSPRW